MDRLTSEQKKALWEAINRYTKSCGGHASSSAEPSTKLLCIEAVNRCIEEIVYPEVSGLTDELLDAAIKKVSDAADLLGWDIHVHTDKHEFCDGIIIGHPQYATKVLDAFEDAESKK